MTNSPNCREVVEFLMAYFENELDPARREAFEHHLHGCGCCHNYLESYRRSIELAKAAMRPAEAPGKPVPEALIKAILAAKDKPS